MIYMRQALKNAEKAFKINEIPVGCVIVCENKIISQSYNQRNKKNNVLYHAEIIAINRACKKLNDWRLENCILYSTLEPCAMCAGAILQARIKKIIFGCYNYKFGCAGSVINLFEQEKFNHKVGIISGLMQNECESVLKKFFKALRETKKIEQKEILS